jgi:hypothetical protein
MKWIFWVAFIIFLIVIGPILTIWAWNVLFGTHLFIETTLETWFAVVILGAVFKTTVRSKE